MTEVVSIERTQRRRICLAFVTGYLPADLRELPKEKLAVSDLEAKHFILAMTNDEMRKIYNGPYAQTFQDNVNAVMQRVREVELKANPPSGNGKIASQYLDFDEKRPKK